MELKSFADGEISVNLRESVRGKSVFVIQSVCGGREPGRSVNDSLMELLLLISTMRRHNAAKITAVLPYYAYARQVRFHANPLYLSLSSAVCMVRTELCAPECQYRLQTLPQCWALWV